MTPGIQIIASSFAFGLVAILFFRGRKQKEARQETARLRELRLAELREKDLHDREILTERLGNNSYLSKVIKSPGKESDDNRWLQLVRETWSKRPFTGAGAQTIADILEALYVAPLETEFDMFDWIADFIEEDEIVDDQKVLAALLNPARWLDFREEVASLLSHKARSFSDECQSLLIELSNVPSGGISGDYWSHYFSGHLALAKCNNLNSSTFERLLDTQEEAMYFMLALNPETPEQQLRNLFRRSVSDKDAIFEIVEAEQVHAAIYLHANCPGELRQEIAAVYEADVGAQIPEQLLSAAKSILESDIAEGYEQIWLEGDFAEVLQN